MRERLARDGDHHRISRRNNSWIVAAGSRSHYRDLLEAGVEVREYGGRLLHAKTRTLDDEVPLICLANIDRRSFELNSENNILLHDADFTHTLRARQQMFLDPSRIVAWVEVEPYSRRRQLLDNSISCSARCSDGALAGAYCSWSVAGVGAAPGIPPGHGNALLRVSFAAMPKQ